MTPVSVAGSKERDCGSLPMMAPWPMELLVPMCTRPAIQTLAAILQPAPMTARPSMMVWAPMVTSSASLALSETMAVGWMLGTGRGGLIDLRDWGAWIQ